MRYYLILFIAFFIPSCVPYSDTPLTNPENEVIDTSICGTWFWKDNTESGYIHIGMDKKTKNLKVIMIDFNKTKELESSEFSGHVSQLKSNQYLNLKWIQPENETDGYIIIKYSVTPRGLDFSIIDDSEIENAIIEGRLKGKRRYPGSLFFQITETQEKLQEFVIKNDTKLFKETKLLSRLVLPDVDIRSNTINKTGNSMENRIIEHNHNEKFFSSPQEAIAIISELLRENDYKSLTDYYDLKGSEIKRSDLESGDFFIRKKRPEISHPSEIWRYKHPFAPGYQYASMRPAAKKNVFIIEVNISIDQGEGSPAQKSFSFFYMKISNKGWQILPDVVKGEITSGEMPVQIID